VVAAQIGFETFGTIFGATLVSLVSTASAGPQNPHPYDQTLPHVSSESQAKILNEMDGIALVVIR
jgi:hypothetical protein